MRQKLLEYSGESSLLVASCRHSDVDAVRISKKMYVSSLGKWEQDMRRVGWTKPNDVTLLAG